MRSLLVADAAYHQHQVTRSDCNNSSFITLALAGALNSVEVLLIVERVLTTIRIRNSIQKLPHEWLITHHFQLQSGGEGIAQLMSVHVYGAMGVWCHLAAPVPRRTG